MPSNMRCHNAPRTSSNARLTVVAKASAPPPPSSNRRAALLAGAGAGLSIIAPRLASAAGSTTCNPGEEGADCRKALLLGDAGKINSTKEGYGSTKTAFTPASGIAANEAMTDEYAARTRAIADEIRQYFSMDPFDKQRIELRKQIGVDGNSWVGKYAKGGSSRRQSARKFYIVVDSIKGWFASNGVAPLPKSKQRKVLEDIDIALAFLEEGK